MSTDNHDPELHAWGDLVERMNAEQRQMRERLAAAEELADFALRFVIYPIGLAGSGEPVEGVRVQGIKAEDGTRLRTLAAAFKRIRSATNDQDQHSGQPK